MLTWNERKVEVGTCGILITAGAMTRQPELERRTISGAVAVDCADGYDRPAWRLVLVDHRPIVVRKLRRIIVHVEQSHKHRASPSQRRNACIITNNHIHVHKARLM